MIPFSPPRIDKKTVAEVTQALESGWITTGPRTKLLEKKIAEYCNVSNVLAVNSWTTGAELLLYWFGVKEGDEVIVPVYTYCATANIVRHRGAKVVMVDISIHFDELKAVLNKESVRTKFKPETKNQEKLGRILLLSDAAHSFGARYKGQPVGSEVDFTVFSFHAVKNLTTAKTRMLWQNIRLEIGSTMSLTLVLNAI